MEKIKTTISIDKDLWTRFIVKVVKLHGGRKGNDIIENMIKEYVNQK